MNIFNKYWILILIFLFFGICEIALSDITCTVSTTPGQVDVSYFIKWNPENSAVINPNGSIELKITGKCPNYIWKVTGDGFWLDADHTITELETSDDTVMVYADGSSCGSALIEITDTCGKTLRKYIRSSTGQWKGCPEPDTGKVSNNMVGYTERKTWVDGKFQWFHWAMRCCRNDEDRAKNGCEWGQCPGEGLAQTTVCADDIGSISCSYGICWEGTSDRNPGHMRYWGCP